MFSKTHFNKVEITGEINKKNFYCMCTHLYKKTHVGKITEYTHMHKTTIFLRRALRCTYTYIVLKKNMKNNHFLSSHYIAIGTPTPDTPA